MTPSASLAQAILGPRDRTQPTRDRIETLSQEIASGRAADTGRALSSDFSQVSRLAHGLREGRASIESLSQAQTWGAAIQASLARVADVSARQMADLPVNLANPDPAAISRLSRGGEEGVRDIVAALGHTVGGRALFANGGTEPPITTVDDILTEVSALATAATDFDDYIQRVDAYFAPGGTFETAHLSVPATDPTRFPAGGGEVVTFEVEAGSDELVQALRSAATLSGLGGASFALTPDARLTLQERAANAAADLPTLQGRIGATEARVGDRLETLRAEEQQAEVDLSTAVGVDPFETVSALQNEMTRLETLYAITARRAQLRLTDYLR
ncbi:hypothetical protein [Jannaschia sp. M317]|uniref:hypothetical protein n=1 Tax=Jannaschia sp. M317 TaxID=2867011 RepID=UPI0021A6A8BA|nr:hypothetical protein [Jannaschia sp. M317]UWQ19005.1 hypothetical protein K3551_06940 [Jannaschia sp. M317]